MYCNSIPLANELDNAFSHAEIQYLLDTRNNPQNPQHTELSLTKSLKDFISKPKQKSFPKSARISIKKQHKKRSNSKSFTNIILIENNTIQHPFLDIWLYCMGCLTHSQQQSCNSSTNTTTDEQLILQYSNSMFIHLKKTNNIRSLMSALQICINSHLQSISDIKQNTTDITFDKLSLITNVNNNKKIRNINQNILHFWKTLKTLHFCMNCILCLAWSQIKMNINDSLFIQDFHINHQPLFIYLFNILSLDQNCDKFPVKKFLTYIRWHFFFGCGMNIKLDKINEDLDNYPLVLNINANRSSFMKKCQISDLFRITNDINVNYVPIIVLPPKTMNINEEKVEEEEIVNNSAHEPPNKRPFAYPLNLLPVRLRCQRKKPRIELFGKHLLPSAILQSLNEANDHLFVFGERRNTCALEIYQYLCLQSKIPKWKLYQNQNENQIEIKDNLIGYKFYETHNYWSKILDGKKSLPMINSQQQWLQNSDKSQLIFKMLLKLLFSCLPSIYISDGKRKMKRNSKNIKFSENEKRFERKSNSFDLRYEISCFTPNIIYTGYEYELIRHETLLAFQILSLLLCILKLFRTHELLHFQWLTSTLNSSNILIILSKIFNHPWPSLNMQLNIVQYQTYKHLLDEQKDEHFLQNTQNVQLLEYLRMDIRSMMIPMNATITTLKSNVLRVMQKCCKYSLIHCKILCQVLRAHKWLFYHLWKKKKAKMNTRKSEIKYGSSYNPSSSSSTHLTLSNVMKYYSLKLFKSMMPFLSGQWREEHMQILNNIRCNLQINVCDKYLTIDLDDKLNDAMVEYEAREMKYIPLEQHEYYYWLALKLPKVDEISVETEVYGGYGSPDFEIYAPLKEERMMIGVIGKYNRWLCRQMDVEEGVYDRERVFFGRDEKEVELICVREIANKVDEKLRSVEIPLDFNKLEYLAQYLSEL